MSSTSRAATLFDDRAGPNFETTLRRFAREVAKRHRGHPADPGALVLALRGYYRTWSLFERLPPLDDSALSLVLAEYQAARFGRRPVAA